MKMSFSSRMSTNSSAYGYGASSEAQSGRYFVRRQLSTNIEFADASHALVFFDLETSGFEKNCEVLQISARHGSRSFNKYINPQYPIPSHVTNVNGLQKINQDLFLHGEKVRSHSIGSVLKKFLDFLKDCDKKCVLIAHSCNFDASRLTRIIKEVSFEDEFSRVVDSFVDTLSLFRKKYPQQTCKLQALAEKYFVLNPNNIHDASYDVLMLQNVAFHQFTVDELLSNVKCFKKTVNYPDNLMTLYPLKNVVSEMIRKRIAFEGIKYNDLFHTYLLGKEKIIKLLEREDTNGKKIIKTKKIMDTIVRHFEQQCN